MALSYSLSSTILYFKVNALTGETGKTAARNIKSAEQVAVPMRITIVTNIIKKRFFLFIVFSITSAASSEIDMYGCPQREKSQHF